MDLKMCDTLHTMEYYSAFKKNNTVPFWQHMGLEYIMLSELSHRNTDTAFENRNNV